MTFQQALARRGIRFRQSGDKVSLNCLWCIERGKPEDKRMRLCIDVKAGWLKCVHCGMARGGHGVQAVLKRLEILDDVEGFERVEIEKEIPVVLPPDFHLLANPRNDLDDMALQYLLDRGITPRQIDHNRIGVSYSGHWAYRVLFPVYVGRELKGINARTFTSKGKPKYLLNKGQKYLYHFDPKADTVVLSEGVFKALRIARTTPWCSSALLGHDLTDRQEEQIARSACTSVVLYPDTDTVGRSGFCRIADKLEALGKSVRVVWPVPAPADDAPLETLKEIVPQAKVFDWGLRFQILTI